MAGRYVEFFSLPYKLYLEDAPVVIEAGKLYHDTKTGGVVGRIRLANVSDAVISAAAVRLIPTRPVGRPVEGEFSELSCAPGEKCAWDEAIEFEDDSLQSFAVEVTEVTFADGSKWTAPADAAWSARKRPAAGRPGPEEAPAKGNKRRDVPDPEEDEEEDEPPKKEKKGSVVIAVVLIVILLLAAVLLYFFVLKNMLAYNAASKLFESGSYAEAETAYLALGEYQDSAELVKECEYRMAKSLFAQGRLEEAEAKFRALGGYKDSLAWADNCLGAIRIRDYDAAGNLMAEGRYAEAKAAYLALGDFKDSEELAQECDYLLAVELMGEGRYDEALPIFAALGDYKDSAALAAECGTGEIPAEEEPWEEEPAEEIPPEEEPPEEPVAEEPAETETAHVYDGTGWQVGQYVFFGNYPQTEAGNDSTPVEWLVLERNGNMALIISRYCLDAQPYYTKLRNVTWEDSTMREWLNETFIYKVFTAAESAAVQVTEVDNGRDQHPNKTNGGNDTRDKIFLLSYTEVQKYFPEKSDRTCTPTAYAVGRDVYVHERSGNTWWWTRSPARTQSQNATLNFEGSRSDYGVSMVSGGVRPALWVDVTKLP